MSDPLNRHRRDWDDMAALDPMWAILGDPALKHNRWPVEEFFASGVRELDDILSRPCVAGCPASFGRALDFGCGVGRVTRALAARFDEAMGFDVSPVMVERARSLSADDPRPARFEVNDRPDLRVVESRSVDLVWSRLVLQHQPSRRAAVRYLDELMRVLAPGGLLVLQIPVAIPWRRALQPRRRAYSALRRLGVPHSLLFSRLGLNPIRMTAIPAADVVRRVTGGGGRVLDFEHTTLSTGIVDGLMLATHNAR